MRPGRCKQIYCWMREEDTLWAVILAVAAFVNSLAWLLPVL